MAYNAATGHYLVTWQDARERDAADVYARAVAGGNGTLGDEFLIYAGEDDQVTPAVAANGTDGDYLVVWQEGDPGDIYGRRTLTETTTGDTFTITGASGYQWSPAVAYSAARNTYLVVWTHPNGGNNDVHGRVVLATGGLLGTELTIASGTPAQSRPAVAANGAGGYVVAWQTYPPVPLPGAGRGSLRPRRRSAARAGDRESGGADTRLTPTGRRSSIVAGRHGRDAYVNNQSAGGSAKLPDGEFPPPAPGGGPGG